MAIMGDRKSGLDSGEGSRRHGCCCQGEQQASDNTPSLAWLPACNGLCSRPFTFAWATEGGGIHVKPDSTGMGVDSGWVVCCNGCCIQHIRLRFLSDPRNWLEFLGRCSQTAPATEQLV